jgi:hypothetical protein
MKKLHLAILAVVTLILLSVTGYAHPTHGNSHELGNKTKLDTVDRENPPPVSPITSSTQNPLVSAWLETRVREEEITRVPPVGKSSAATEFIAPDEEMEMGGGWCNNCGCWMRHGCDNNGNCNIGHNAVCVPSCSFHYGSCVNSG